MHLYPHPWGYLQLDVFSDEDLMGLYNEIDEKRIGGYISVFQQPGVKQTQSRIMSTLNRRNGGFMGISRISLHQQSLGSFPSLSSGLSITQTAPMPNLTIQNIPAPQQNVTFVPAPAPAPLPPPAALPDKHMIQEFDAYGNCLGVRPETEKEKDDREYAAWKAEHGAK